LPRLSDLRLDEVAIDDGDLNPLLRLPRWTDVVIPSRFLDNPSRYSHTLTELRTLIEQR
jgi:hypothetical protein